MKTPKPPGPRKPSGSKSGDTGPLPHRPTGKKGGVAGFLPLRGGAGVLNGTPGSTGGSGTSGT